MDNRSGFNSDQILDNVNGPKLRRPLDVGGKETVNSNYGRIVRLNFIVISLVRSLWPKRNCALLYYGPGSFFCEPCESGTAALIRNVHAYLRIKIK